MAADSKTQAVARAYGAGEASIAQVVAAARAGARANRDGPLSGSSMARMVNDESQSLDLETWDGVVSVYGDGGMTKAQFRAAYDAYMG